MWQTELESPFNQAEVENQDTERRGGWHDALRERVTGTGHGGWQLPREGCRARRCLRAVQRTRGWCSGADRLSAATAPMMQFVRAKGKIKGEPSPQAKLKMGL